MFLVRYIILFFIVHSFTFAVREVRLEYKRQNADSLDFDYKNEYRVITTSMSEVNKLHALIDGIITETIVDPDFEGKIKIKKIIVVKHIKLNGYEDKSSSENLKKPSNYEYLLDKYKGNVQVVGSKDFRKEDLMNMNIVFPKKKLRSGNTWKSKYSYFFNLGKRKKISVFGKFKLVSIIDGYAKIIGKFVGDIGKTRKINYEGRVKLNFDMLFDIENGYFVSGKVSHSLRYESRTDLAMDYKKFVSDGSRLGYKLDFKSSFKLKED
ncbi:MAG: hypothetical protein COB02_04470 [Candidatus Cloacimonadota bacterium]|nr:MAG: hypothetical protein COB02_04470 [Candidatus Cloacimonadota bacterium]